LVVVGGGDDVLPGFVATAPVVVAAMTVPCSATVVLAGAIVGLGFMAVAGAWRGLVEPFIPAIADACLMLAVAAVWVLHAACSLVVS
jgi:phosphate/sulfate permease